MTNEQLKGAADEYFGNTDIAEWRISDAALRLNLTYDEIMRADKSRPDYETLKYVKLKLMSAYELRLNKRGNSGDVFALKCLGWTDREVSERADKTAAERLSISELYGDKF